LPVAVAVAVPVSVGTVPSTGLAVNDQGQAMITLVCPATPSGCDASGVLVIHLPANLLELAADRTAGASSATGTVLESFAGRSPAATAP
jgi:hypothetical protein